MASELSAATHRGTIATTAKLRNETSGRRVLAALTALSEPLVRRLRPTEPFRIRLNAQVSDPTAPRLRMLSGWMHGRQHALPDEDATSQHSPGRGRLQWPTSHPRLVREHKGTLAQHHFRGLRRRRLLTVTLIAVGRHRRSRWLLDQRAFNARLRRLGQVRSGLLLGRSLGPCQ